MAELQFADLFNPPEVTPGTEPTPLFPLESMKPAFWVMVQLKDMGSATYVRLGDNVRQADELMGAGDFRVYDVPPGWAFNAAKMYCISDAADAVITIQGMGPGF